LVPGKRITPFTTCYLQTPLSAVVCNHMKQNGGMNDCGGNTQSEIPRCPRNDSLNVVFTPTPLGERVAATAFSAAGAGRLRGSDCMTESRRQKAGDGAHVSGGKRAGGGAIPQTTNHAQRTSRLSAFWRLSTAYCPPPTASRTAPGRSVGIWVRRSSSSRAPDRAARKLLGSTLPPHPYAPGYRRGAVW